MDVLDHCMPRGAPKAFEFTAAAALAGICINMCLKKNLLIVLCGAAAAAWGVTAEFFMDITNSGSVCAAEGPHQAHQSPPV